MSSFSALNLEINRVTALDRPKSIKKIDINDPTKVYNPKLESPILFFIQGVYNKADKVLIKIAR
jgi:hypothetical protein